MLKKQQKYFVIVLLICNTVGIVHGSRPRLPSFSLHILAYYGGYTLMHINLILMLGALVLLAVSGLLVFCFTESKGKNTAHARKFVNNSKSKPVITRDKATRTSSRINMEKTLV